MSNEKEQISEKCWPGYEKKGMKKMFGKMYPNCVKKAKKISEEWKTHGGHQDPADKKLDQAVLHADNRLPFKEVIAVMDAIYETQRDFKVGGGAVEKAPAFNMTFSVR